MTGRLFGLALTQGITEAFPVSSSAHLVLLSYFFHWTPRIDTEVALHCGTLVALCLIFWKDIVSWLRGALDFLKQIKTPDRRFLSLMIVATCPVMMGGFLVHSAHLHIHNRSLMALATIFFSGLLYMAHTQCPSTRSMAKLTFPGALYIGCFQILALFPGVSRLGICITAARLLGYDLVSAVRLSFLMAIPSIAGALILKYPVLVKAQGGALWQAIGLSCVVSFPLILFFMALSHKKNCLTPFVIYRCLLGLLLFFL